MHTGRRMSESLNGVSQLIGLPTRLPSHTDERTNGLTERSLTQVTHLALCDARTHVKGISA